MKLVIVESPSKAKTIAKYLGSEYRVKASGGHINDLPEKRLGIDVENNFQPEYVINEDKKRTIEDIKSTLAKSQQVFLATDPDREGEAISWHLKNVLGIPDGKIRIEFNEISKKAVQKAIESPREINMKLVNQQQARRVLDRLVGYKVSPLLGKKIKTGLSAGRVQSAALRMLVDREREIRNFKPEEYWTLNAFLSKGGESFKSTFAEINGKKAKIPNREFLDNLISTTENKEYVVSEVKRAVKKVRPQPPFTTSTLQQDGTIKLGITAPQVMKIAQQLYEGFEIEGEGHVALVTYIRTDSVRVSDDAMWDAKRHIIAKYGAEYAPKTFNKYEQKGAAQDAHEAIRPISLDRTPESLKGKLSKNNYQLYKLIYDRFVASQMASAQYDTLSVKVNVVGDDEKTYCYHVNGRAMIFPGYTVLYNDASAEKEESNGINLPDMVVGDKLDFQKHTFEQKFTKPPLRYTEASLVKAMEENGIGRPSTYASIISVLTKRAYYDKSGKYMVPTELGEVVCDTLTKYFPDIINLKFTANMEKELDSIEEGVEWQSIISEFYPHFIQEVKLAFYDGSSVKLNAEVSDVPCDKCGAMMIVKEGRYGKFLACPNYPSCKNIKNLHESIVGKCPYCSSDVAKKVSKTGKIFYGCTAYPKCKFALWDLPAPTLCPECNKPMKVVTVKGQTKYVCTACPHSELK